jgi:hypothetical protein
MSAESGAQVGNEKRANVLPVGTASGPGFLGPSYNPADEMLPPAAVGVRRGGDLGDVVGAVKGIIYYGDMIGFGAPSSGFTRGMPGLRPLGVNYFVNSGLTCSNGATMWEYVKTIPEGNALGNKVRDALKGVGLPALRGMAPGMVEDVKFALNPYPVINAVVGSGYPKCKLVKNLVGDIDGKITNVDGVLLVDPVGLIKGGDGRYYQQRWVQDYYPVQLRTAQQESQESAEDRAEPIQLAYEDWEKEPKVYKEDGCRKDPAGTEAQPMFCSAATKTETITLIDGKTVIAQLEGYENYNPMNARFTLQKKPTALLSLSVAAISVVFLISFWGNKGSLFRK